MSFVGNPPARGLKNGLAARGLAKGFAACCCCCCLSFMFAISGLCSFSIGSTGSNFDPMSARSCSSVFEPGNPGGGGTRTSWGPSPSNAFWSLNSSSPEDEKNKI